MKSINKKIYSDPIAEARKGKYFNQYSKEAKQRIKLGVEIYNARENLGMSQQKLAQKALTTQKVISRIENGDVNIGFALLNRIASALNFNNINWSNVLGINFIIELSYSGLWSETINNTKEIKENFLSHEVHSLSIN